MAVDAVRYGSRSRKQDSRAAKERREKIILGVAGVVLLLLLVWQGPKTLKRLHPSSTPPAASVPAPFAGAGATAAPPTKPVNLKQFERFAAKDPFVAQVGAQTSAAPSAAHAVAPAVRTSNFVSKDPFVQQLSLTSTAPVAPSAGGGTHHDAGAPAGATSYIVMVASIPVASGRQSAEQAAALARKRGVSSVKIVDSSNYATLRSGFYAVYSGPYASLSATLTALERVRSHGYVSAYTRRIAH